ncbi:MAG: 50S ribosomal protein L23 [Candidatus Sungbacteria bacterium RIFCSPHIGHO2_01_FULL_50_25]|uniref:Large ribosomal subunit protein uL23 n=1 Tax=Candidatus Sungbacteria bacterium RIFCSPHIGHO2_01_FULL_50_25 TaxID=1802265 RepID=A0A1G2KAW7_9BACT|nr:MAG: 50S ribosomal protein L23 [Candidatus Sungbacteria bacterium RIFCSPHIGHO2_01_FULL_50_25]
MKRAHITEKSNSAGERGTYTFVVASQANKSEVKRAVEAKYGVLVRRVNVLSMPGKVRRRGRQVGWKSGFKKAVVVLQEGERIDTQ